MVDNAGDAFEIMDMKANTEQVLDAALHLPQTDRAFLVERLLESLDAESGFPLSEKWRKEISRRCAEIDSGEVELVSGEQVFKQAFKALE